MIHHMPVKTNNKVIFYSSFPDKILSTDELHPVCRYMIIGTVSRISHYEDAYSDPYSIVTIETQAQSYRRLIEGTRELYTQEIEI